MLQLDGRCALILYESHLYEHHMLWETRNRSSAQLINRGLISGNDVNNLFRMRLGVEIKKKNKQQFPGTIMCISVKH